MQTNYPEITADMVKRNRINQFKNNTMYKHSHWQPELNETVAGEVVCDRYLLIKNEHGHIVRFGSDMRRPPFFDDSGACIAQAGDFVAITYKGAGKYLIAIEKRNPREWWWNIARDDFDKQRAIDDEKMYAEISCIGGFNTVIQMAMLNGFKPR